MENLDSKIAAYRAALLKALQDRGIGAASNSEGGSYPSTAPQGSSPLNAVANAAIKEKIRGLISGGSPSLTSSEAAQAAWNAPGMEASQAAWNAGASAPLEVATTEVPVSGWSLGNIGSAGNYFLPALGVAGAADLFGNKRHGTRGAAQGAASGAAMGSYFGPQGAIAGALIGGGVGAFGNLGDRDRYKTEFNRAQKLRDSGINWNFNATEPTHGMTREQLAEIARATGGNEKFAMGRNEADTTGKDWLGYAFLPEKFGSGYTESPMEKQLKAAQMLVDANAIREHHGTADYNENFTPELESKIRELLSAKA